MTELEASREKKVLMGTCGWSDHTLLKCGRFYPANVRSAEDRIRHYSTHFPCVEVDTSTYAIPSTASIKGWLRCVPKGFLFHFKAFGFFCSKSCSLAALPVHIRGKIAAACPGKDYIQLNAIPASLRDELWQLFNTALAVAHAAGRLGVVVFQFHLSFKPTHENQAHVEWCRKNLDPRYPMAAEFRCREWFDEQHLASTTHWLHACGIALVAADELWHETFQKDREQMGLLKGQERVILPVAWALTQPCFMYVRVHRREGSQRLLSESELLCWASRLKANLTQELKGPIYFMWGTDWEDQPITNAKSLDALLADMAFDWKTVQHYQLSASGKMLDAYFSQNSEKKKKATKSTLTQRQCPCPSLMSPAQEINPSVDEDANRLLEVYGVHEFPLDEGNVKVETLPSLPLPSSKTQHSQVISGFLGIKQTSKNMRKQKNNAPFNKASSSITTYFRKSSPC